MNSPANTDLSLTVAYKDSWGAHKEKMRRERRELAEACARNPNYDDEQDCHAAEYEDREESGPCGDELDEEDAACAADFA